MKHELILIVKGNKFKAAQAAADHNIPFIFVEEISSKTGVVTIGKTAATVKKISAWFIDQLETPFPVGTLLHYYYVNPNKL